MEGLIFEVLGYGSTSNNVSVGVLHYSNTSNYFDVNKHIRTIKSKIIGKMTKYKLLAESEKLSLSIAIIPKSLASANEERLKSIIKDILRNERVINSIVVLKQEGFTRWKHKIYYNLQPENSFYLYKSN